MEWKGSKRAGCVKKVSPDLPSCAYNKNRKVFAIDAIESIANLVGFKKVPSHSNDKAPVRVDQTKARFEEQTTMVTSRTKSNLIPIRKVGKCKSQRATSTDGRARSKHHQASTSWTYSLVIRVKKRTDSESNFKSAWLWSQRVDKQCTKGMNESHESTNEKVVLKTKQKEKEPLQTPTHTYQSPKPFDKLHKRVKRSKTVYNLSTNSMIQTQRANTTNRMNDKG